MGHKPYDWLLNIVKQGTQSKIINCMVNTYILTCYIYIYKKFYFLSLNELTGSSSFNISDSNFCIWGTPRIYVTSN